MSALFQPLKIGRLTLSHRIVMAPLTRFRADTQSVHHQVAAEYYEQRATPGGLIISEATLISQRAGGYVHVPGIYSEAQIEAWKSVTDRIHAKGGFVFVQLWAQGRAADPDVMRASGNKYTAPSAIPMEEGGPVPEVLTNVEIICLVNDFVQAAQNALKAGFDGVEIHGANGYLLDQFLQTNSNQRTDEYGGSIENRARFTLMVIKAVSDAIGEDRVAIRFSPFSTYQGMRMKDPFPTFSYVTREIRDRHPNLAYIHFVEGRVSGNVDVDAAPHETSDFARAIWNENGERPFLTAGGYGQDGDAAEKVVQQHGGAAVFGRAFISNPDLVNRIKHKVPLTPHDRATFYFGQGPEAIQGYLDYKPAQIPTAAMA